MNDDAELRARFGALRRHDEAGAPPFAAVLERAAKRRPSTAWAAPAAAAAAVVATTAAALWLALRPATVEPTVLALPPWSTTTRSLLAAAAPLPDLSPRGLPTDGLIRIPTFEEGKPR